MLFILKSKLYIFCFLFPAEDLSTRDGSATSGVDYGSLSSEEVTFAPGAESQTVSIRTEDDRELEGAETFQVLLSSDDGTDLGQRVVFITILDDDR